MKNELQQIGVQYSKNKKIQFTYFIFLLFDSRNCAESAGVCEELPRVHLFRRACIQIKQVFFCARALKSHRRRRRHDVHCTQKYKTKQCTREHEWSVTLLCDMCVDINVSV